jgi:spore germination protein YaaH
MQQAAPSPSSAGTRTAPSQAAPNSAAASAAGTNREVFGFVYARNLSNSQVGYPSWNFRALSTVAFFGLHVDESNGNLITANSSTCTDCGDAWNAWNTQISGLQSAIQASGYHVNVVLTIILQDTTAGMCTGLEGGNAANTISQTVQQVHMKAVNGVNVDYEGTGRSCSTTNPADTTDSRFTAFVAGLRNQLPAPYLLSVDTYGSSAKFPGGFFDIPGLAPNVDYFFVMAYDLDRSNVPGPEACSGSYCLSPVAPTTGPYTWNDTAIAGQYTAVVAPSKVVLGVPYYGRKACVAPLTAPRPGPNAPVAFGSTVSPTYAIATTDASQPGVSNYAFARDAYEGIEPYATWQSSAANFNCWRESYWDDTFSLGHKYDLVNQDGLRGVGIFTLDYGGGAPELWDLLAQKFSNTASVGGRAIGAPSAASWSTGRLDVVVRGTDNQLWHDFNTGGGWNLWEPLGGRISTSPAVVSWGPGRLDVFARGTDNQLWHKWYGTDVGWSLWEPLGGVLASAPAAASWGNGRLDVFAAGSDGQLWHKWYGIGSGWSLWEPLGGRLAGDPGAAAWAPNRIDVFVRGTDAAMWHRWWDGTAWRGWEPLGGVLNYGVAADSKGANLLDTFVTGVDGATWRNSWTGSAWTSWLWVGGSWTSAPSAVAAGGGAVDLFMRGQDGAVWEVGLSS